MKKMTKITLATLVLVIVFSSMVILSLEYGNPKTGYNSKYNTFNSVYVTVTIYGGPKAGGGFYMDRVYFTVHTWTSVFVKVCDVYVTENIQGEIILDDYQIHDGCQRGEIDIYHNHNIPGYWFSHIVVFAEITVEYNFKNFWGRSKTWIVTASVSYE